MATFRDRVFALARQVPRGRVCTYTDLAHAAGSPRAARQVGWALSGIPAGAEVPWWRVVKSAGRVPSHDCREVQVELLRNEGVEVDPAGSLDLRRYGWDSFDPGQDSDS